MIYSSVIDLIHHDDFLLLPDFSRKFKTYLKIEGFNVGCSIKLKAAKNMLESLEHKGIVRSGAKIIESSSGNLGLALSIICATKNYKFTCVSDPNISVPPLMVYDWPLNTWMPVPCSTITIS